MGVDHVAINVKDLDRSLEFYTKVIGLKISPREHQKPGTEHFLDCGPSLVGLIQGNAAEGLHLLQNEGIGANHLSFRVRTTEFDAAVEELKKNGVPVNFVKKRDRSWSVYFEDPDGNKLEITAWPQEDKEK